MFFGKEYGLAFNSFAKDDWRRIAGPVIQGFPDYLSGPSVKSNNGCPLAADIDQNIVLFHQRGARTPEEQQLGIKFLQGINLPDLGSFLRIKAGQESGNPVRKDPAAGHRWSRPGSIAEFPFVRRTLIGGLPQGSALDGIKGIQELFLGILYLGVKIHFALGHHRRTVAFADRLPPQDF